MLMEPCQLEASQRLAAAITASRWDTELLLDSDELSDAFSNFLWALLISDPRDDWRKESPDDGLVFFHALVPESRVVELAGFVWWINQSTEPLWTRLRVTENGGSLDSYEVKCGLLDEGQVRERLASQWAQSRHVQRLVRGEHLESHAWFSGQLSPDSPIWFFEFSG